MDRADLRKLSDTLERALLDCGEGCAMSILNTIGGQREALRRAQELLRVLAKPKVAWGWGEGQCKNPPQPGAALNSFSHKPVPKPSRSAMLLVSGGGSLSTAIASVKTASPSRHTWHETQLLQVCKGGLQPIT